MRSPEGKVLSLKDREELGIPEPEYEEEDMEVGERKIHVVRQLPEKPQIIEFPKKKEKNPQEELQKAA